MARASGDLPICQLPVPQESMCRCSVIPCSVTSCRNTPSAVGERQMLPRQTNNTLTWSGITSSCFYQSPHPGQILFGIDARCGRSISNIHVDVSTVIQGPELFQRFHLFCRCRRPADKLAEHTGTVAINANVPEVTNALG